MSRVLFRFRGALFCCMSFAVLGAQVCAAVLSLSLFLQMYGVKSMAYAFALEALVFVGVNACVWWLQKYFHSAWTLFFGLCVSALVMMTVWYCFEHEVLVSGRVWVACLFVWAQGTLCALLNLLFSVCGWVLPSRQRYSSVNVFGCVGGICSGLLLYWFALNEEFAFFAFGLWSFLLLGCAAVLLGALWWCPGLLRTHARYGSRRYKRVSWLQLGSLLKDKGSVVFLVCACFGGMLVELLFYSGNDLVVRAFPGGELPVFLALTFACVHAVDLLKLLSMPVVFQKYRVSRLVLVQPVVYCVAVVGVFVLPDMLWVGLVYYVWWYERGVVSYVLYQFFMHVSYEQDRESFLHALRCVARAGGLCLAAAVVVFAADFTGAERFIVVTMFLLVFVQLSRVKYKTWIRVVQEHMSSYRIVSQDLVFSKLLRKELQADFLYLSSLMEKCSVDLCAFYLSACVVSRSSQLRVFLHLNFNNFSVKVQSVVVRHLACEPDDEDKKFLLKEFREGQDEVRVAVMKYFQGLPTTEGLAQAQRILDQGQFYPQYKSDAFLYVFEHSSAYLKVKLSNRLLSYAHFGDDEEKRVVIHTASQLKNLELFLDFFPSLRSQSLIASWFDAVLPYAHRLDSAFLEHCIRVFDDSTWSVREKCLRLFRMVDCSYVFPELMHQFEYAREEEQLALLEIARAWSLLSAKETAELLKETFLPLSVFMKLAELWKQSKDIPKQFREYKTVEDALSQHLNRFMNCYCVLEEQGHTEPLLLKTLIQNIQHQLTKLVIWNLFKLPEYNTSDQILHMLNTTHSEGLDSGCLGNIYQYLKLRKNPALWKGYYIKDTALGSVEKVFEHLIFHGASSWLIAVSMYSSQFLPVNSKISLEHIYSKLEGKIINYPLVKEMMYLFDKGQRTMLSIFDKIALFEQVTLFSSLSFQQLQILADLSEVIDFQAGEQIVSAGQLGDKMYIIERGAVSIQKGSTWKTLTTHEYFGELNILSNRKHTHTVKATESTRIIVIRGENFRKSLHKADLVFSLLNCIIDANTPNEP